MTNDDKENLPVVTPPVNFRGFTKILEQQLFYIKHKYGFIGLVLQCIAIKANAMVPRAGVCLNEKTRKIEMLINPEFFASLTDDEQVAVLLHEIYHLTHKHVYMGQAYAMNDRRTLNIAMDLAINQLIKGLPEHAATIEKFNQKDGAPFPANKTTEYYYDQLKQLKQDSKDKGEGSPDEKGNPQGQIKDKHGNVWEDSFDLHEWDNVDPEELMKAAKDLFQRAKQKASMEYTNIPHDIEDLIRELSEALTRLNHKKLLDDVYKRSIPNSDRALTWKKPSKRYNQYSPGTKADNSPRIDTYLDTSGSISVEEFNEFMAHNDKFIKYANKKCELNFFHTSLYHKEKYKIGKPLDPRSIRSGGTDLQEVFDKIEKTKPDLSIIFTDGCYGAVRQTTMPCQVLFVISENGTVDHPMKNVSNTKTVKMAR